MTTYIITETARYEIEAEDGEHALNIFLDAENRDAFFKEVSERDVEAKDD